MARLAERLALIVRAAALLTVPARRFRAWIAPVLPDGLAAAGIAVVGLVIVGLAMMNGLHAYWAAAPSTLAAFVGTAVLVNLGSGLAGALLFSSWGLKDALTVGLVSGNRNVTLAWAAAGATLPPATEAYMAACVLPVLALPLAMKTVLALRARRLDFAARRLGNAA
ncbi:hypothetical protein [Salinarimonas soli]|uniref:Bile acid:sodium symporter n=1 Tax=Salinarimonas soli TaxID=1638099 RepID=A0A5B2VF04_9HYPH|nr:hypothetical protein [Salinarimonas soli]KAA2237198.1 hypothetical protein F0L46_09285 [Salinarimonas soli]